jgi:hypothetical protein
MNVFISSLYDNKRFSSMNLRFHLDGQMNGMRYASTLSEPIEALLVSFWTSITV